MTDTPPPAAAPRVLRIAVVEDEAVLSMELESVIEHLGHVVSGAAMSSDEATLLPATAPDLALVDIHLADGPTGIDVGRRFARSGIAVVFMTANLKRIPPDYAGALGAIGKPYTQAGVEAALAHVVAMLGGGASPGPPPSSLIVAATAPYNNGAAAP